MLFVWEVHKWGDRPCCSTLYCCDGIYVLLPKSSHHTLVLGAPSICIGTSVSQWLLIEGGTVLVWSSNYIYSQKSVCISYCLLDVIAEIELVVDQYRYSQVLFNPILITLHFLGLKAICQVVVKFWVSLQITWSHLRLHLDVTLE